MFYTGERSQTRNRSEGDVGQRGFLFRSSRRYLVVVVCTATPVVGMMRFELTTACSQSRCSTKLSFIPERASTPRFEGGCLCQFGYQGMSAPARI